MLEVVVSRAALGCVEMLSFMPSPLSCSLLFRSSLLALSLSLTPSLPSLHTFPALSYTARFLSRPSHPRCSGFVHPPHQDRGGDPGHLQGHEEEEHALDPPRESAPASLGSSGS